MCVYSVASFHKYSSFFYIYLIQYQIINDGVAIDAAHSDALCRDASREPALQQQLSTHSLVAIDIVRSHTRMVLIHRCARFFKIFSPFRLLDIVVICIS